MAVIGYGRVSTDKQEHGAEAQKDAIGAWARANKEFTQNILIDEDVGGAEAIENCPMLIVALGEIEKSRGGVTALVVAKRDRLGRDVIKVAMIERLVEKAGARVISCAGEGNGDDPAAKLMRRIIDAFAEYERAMIRERTKAALAAKKARGERIGGLPYGMKEVRGKMVPNESEIQLIKYARVLRGENLSYRQVAAKLNENGFKTRAGASFDPAAVRRMCL